MNIIWSEAKIFAQLVKLAGETGRDEPPDVDAIKALGFTFTGSVTGQDAKGKPATFGFVAQDITRSLLVCALRGTAVKDLVEWLDDAEAVPVPSPFGHGLVHLGFKNVYDSLHFMTFPIRLSQSLRTGIAAGGTIITAGHSLGGALATLLAMDLLSEMPRPNVESYTFASPRVGDAAFANWYNLPLAAKTYRVENCFDAVPNLPTVPPYEHVETKFRVVGDILDPVWKQHELDNYLRLIEKHL